MARKKIIDKSKPEEEVQAEVEKDEAKPKKKTNKATKKAKALETPKDNSGKPEEDIDAFDIDTVPAAGADGEELSEVEQALVSEEEEQFKEEIQEERFYVIPLAKNGYEKTPEWKRSKRAIKIIQEFLTRHMKPEGKVYVSQEVNERVWERGIKNPPRKIRVRVTKSVDGIVRAYLA